MKFGSSLLPLLCLALAGCAADKKKEPEKKPESTGPKLVGRIATVPADKRFVLIQSYGKWEGSAGQILTTRGESDRTANLKITGESLGEFAAADIQSGEVQTGDAVYSQHKPLAPPAAIPAEVPQVQGNAPLENVQKNN